MTFVAFSNADFANTRISDDVACFAVVKFLFDVSITAGIVCADVFDLGNEFVRLGRGRVENCWY